MPLESKPKPATAKFAQTYLSSLRTYLDRRAPGGLLSARDLGCRAITLGLETLDLARIHEGALVGVLTAAPSEVRLKRATVFFTEAILPIEKTHQAARRSAIHLARLNVNLRERSADLASSNKELVREVAQRKLGEAALRKSEKSCADALAISLKQQQELRLLSRRYLTAQEQERLRISRELHDVIAQMLSGINLHLAAIKTEASGKTRGLVRSIASTQRLVEKSVDIVHRFARELRPAMLDDLGLIPALKAHVCAFIKATGIQMELSTFSGLDVLGLDTRTALYRVAQEALSNIARHSKATKGSIVLEKSPGGARMRISDNGRSFDPRRIRRGTRLTRLGLVGMRERVEMLGGRFSVETRPGKGTTIIAEIPLAPVEKKVKPA